MHKINLISLLAIIAAGCSLQPDWPGIKFKNKHAVVITLDELDSGKIPDHIWEMDHIVELRIEKTASDGHWVIFPPNSSFETRELTPPYWEIPKGIEKLKNLKNLHLSYLDIPSLPEGISKLDKLETLNLSLNKLQLSNELPKFREMKAIKDLFIAGNHFNPEEMKAFVEEFPDVKIEYTFKSN